MSKTLFDKIWEKHIVKTEHATFNGGDLALDPIAQHGTNRDLGLFDRARIADAAMFGFLERACVAAPTCLERNSAPAVFELHHRATFLVVNHRAERLATEFREDALHFNERLISARGARVR